MKRLPQLGKVHKDFLENIVLSKLNSKSDLLIGPKYGFDSGVIKIDDNKIMVIATDPISIIPSLNIRDSAWLSVHLLASDIMTSGIKPIYASINFNLPPEIQDSYFKQYWNHMTNEFNNLDNHLNKKSSFFIDTTTFPETFPLYPVIPLINFKSFFIILSINPSIASLVFPEKGFIFGSSSVSQ